MKRVIISLTLLVSLGLVAVPAYSANTVEQTPNDSVSYAVGQEIIESRTRTSKTHYLGETLDGRSRYALDVSIGSVHYKDDSDDSLELWKDIDTTIQVSSKPNWNWEVVKGNWQLLINEDTTVAVGKDGNWIGFRYEGLAYLDINTKEYVILDTRRAVTPTIIENKIRWEDIFYGVNLEYIYGVDSFKENLEITQVARDWLANNPPSSYGLSNQSSYLVGYIEVDWRNAYPVEDETGEAISWDIANEFEASSIFFRHPIKDYLVAALPLDWASHEEVEPENWVPIRKRFIKKGDTHYLLFGSKITSLNQMPAGMITFDPNVTVQVGASFDDAHESESSRTMDRVGAEVRNNSNTDATYRTWGGYRFVSAEFPESGTTIDVAYLTGNIYSASYDDANINIHFEELAAPAAFSGTGGDITDRDRTENSAEWIANSIGTGWKNSPSLCGVGSPIQEIFDSLSPTAIVVITRPNQDVNKSVRFYSWDFTGNASGAKLYLEWSGGVSLPTVTTQAATDIEDTTATGNGNITNTGGENCDKRGIVWDLATQGAPGNVAPGASGYANFEEESNGFGAGAFTRALTGLPTGDIIYARAYAHNSEGYAYGDEINFLTKPAAPANVAATDGAHTDKVVITWTKSTGATGYKVYEGANLLDTLGDVATYDDVAAAAGSITHSGNVTASDGTSSSYVTLSLANEATANGSSRTYKVVALNGTGDSDDSATDAGYRGVGGITYQWQMSDADSDAAYNTNLGTTDPYNATEAPAFPAARWFQCEVSSVGASNTPQTSDADRGYRSEAPPPPSPEDDPRDPDLVYWELRPNLDETGIIKKNHVPTTVWMGVFAGYSLPVWNSDNETLYFEICVPDRWDESSDIYLHVKTATTDNQSGNTYELEVGWDKVTPNVPEAVPTGAPNIVTVTRTIDSALTYACYRDWFTVDYDIESDDPIEADDTIAFRFRRFGNSDNLTSELIVFEFVVLFARGDLLGDPDNIVTEEDMEEIGTQFGVFNTILAGWAAYFLIGFGLLLIIGLSCLAFWRSNAPLFMVTAGASLIFGFYWYDAFTTNLGLAMGLMLIAYSLVCFGFAFRMIFWRDRLREE